MERANKPSAIPVAQTKQVGPQPSVEVSGSRVTATLLSGESVAVSLHGATVVSWRTADGVERLFLSEKSALDGSRPVRGGIPLVFPVFGPPPKAHATGALPQHGFARNSTWEFLGRSSAEATDADMDSEGPGMVKLDFGLSGSMVEEKFRVAWPFDFGLVYSVTLARGRLTTTMQVQNQGEMPFEFQVLLHNYFSVNDISTVQVKGLESKEYADKVDGGTVKAESLPAVFITSEIDRVYKALDPAVPVEIVDGSKTVFSLTRESLTDMVVWNPWIEKAKAMEDFSPDEAYKNMICVEAGYVAGWQTLDPGEAWECGQTIKAE